VTRQPTRRRRRWARVAAVCAGLAVAGHLWLWYLPRVRQARPRAGDVPAALLADERFAVRVWLPYPHQTLGSVSRSVGDAGSWLESLARLAGSSSLRLPSFGPFAVPPARELTLAQGEGGTLVMAARIYPTMALVGRLAGLVARNPWLAGGEVSVAGRSGRVAWRGTLWTLESGDIALAEELLPPSPRTAPAAAAIAVAEAPAPLRAGTYVVSRTSSGAVVCRLVADGRAPEPTVPAPVSPGVALVLVERDERSAETGDGDGEPLRALLLALPSRREPGELPGAAALARPGGRRFVMPGEGLSSLIDLQLHERHVEGIDVVALDRESLEAAARLAPALARGGGAGVELWLDPAVLAELAGHLGRTFDELPGMARDEIRFWQDVERVLAPLAGFRTGVLVSSRGGVEARLEPRARLTGPR
jgi:hypothetical protein